MMDRYQATVAATDALSTDVRRIWLDFGPAGGPRFEPGGHLDFEIPVGSVMTTRSYSIVEEDGEGRLCIAVKLAPQSRGGSLYMWSLSAGDQLVVYSTSNNLPVAYSGTDYVLLAGGIGITPLIGIGRSLRASGKSVRFIYCVRDLADAPFVHELAVEHGADFTVHEEKTSGLLDIPALISTLAPRAFLYMCGPSPMMDAVNRSWRQHGLPVDHLRFETFGTAGRFPTVAFEVQVVETGQTIQVAANQSMLDALLAADQPTMFDCRKGECGLCKVKVVSLDGEIDHRDVFLSGAEKVDGTEMCCCVSRIYGSRVEVHIDSIMHGRGPDATARQSKQNQARN